MTQTRRKNRNGFTLIELIVVVIIIAVLAIAVVPNVLGRIDDARVSAAIGNIKTFGNLIDLYHADTGQMPPTLDALITNPGVPKWNGPYIKNQDKIQMDPWDHPYVYKAPGDNNREYDIVSAGKDGIIGTADDIQSWNLQKK